MSKARDLARLVVWVLPASAGKNALLRRLGHDVAPTATARSSLVWRVERIRMAEDSRIGRWNLIKNMREVSVAGRASIGRLNVVSSHPVYARLYRDGAALHVEDHGKITSRHHLDCSGGVTVGSFASIAGSGTTLLTHSVDLRRDAQVARPIDVGAYSFVGARCMVLGGAVLPERSVLGAGSVLTRSREERDPGLWAGVPAAHRGSVGGAWFERTTTHTKRVYIPGTGETVEDAF